MGLRILISYTDENDNSENAHSEEMEELRSANIDLTNEAMPLDNEKTTFPKSELLNELPQKPFTSSPYLV